MIDLKDYEKASIERVNQDLQIPLYTLQAKNNWYYKDNNYYYFKKIYDQEKISKELLGVLISKYFSLPTISYSLASTNDSIGLLSKNFRKQDKKYKTSEDLSLTTNTTYSTTNLLALKKLSSLLKDKTSLSLIQNDIITFMIRDYYSDTSDKMGVNYLFEVSKNLIRLAPLYDYEVSFNEDKDYYHNDLLNFYLPDSYTHFEKYPQIYQELQRILSLNINKLLSEVEVTFPLEHALKTQIQNIDESKKSKVYSLLRWC